MAIFKKNTKKTEKQAAPVAAPAVREEVAMPTAKKHAGSVVLAPRITEKGAYMAEQGAYVFNVAPGAGKKEIAEAVRTIFKVEPRKVRVVPVRAKEIRNRATNRKGKTAGGKKAYVYLKSGEKIDIA